jgi:hypothetical protein
MAFFAPLRTFAQILFICIQPLLVITIDAQQGTSFAKTDEKALAIPKNQTKNYKDIATYFSAAFEHDEDRLRAVYIWISENIRYEMAIMNEPGTYKHINELVEYALQKRRGICMHIAALYSAVANEMGYPAFLVEGLTRSENEVNPIGHAWNVVLLNDQWYMVDATWGSGYIQNNQFIREIDNSYFLATPEKFIYSHFPFDPIWQIQHYPLPLQSFIKGKFTENDTTVFFNYSDSISIYSQQNKELQITHSIHRIKSQTPPHRLVNTKIDQLQKELNYLKSLKGIDAFNLAINEYNSGVSSLNTFLSHREKNMKTAKSKEDCLQLLQQAEDALNFATQHMQLVNKNDSKIRSNALSLEKSIAVALKDVKVQQAFVNQYYKKK